VNFIGPFAALDRRLAQRVREDAWDSRAVCSKMFDKAMLFAQSIAVTHSPVMALDEDAAIAR